MSEKPEVAQIISALEKIGDPERVEKSKEYIPTAMRVIGVKVPDLRRVVKTIGKRMRKESPAVIKSFARELISTDCLECRQMAYELLNDHKEALAGLNSNDLEMLGRGIDNWGSVDTFAVLLSGPAWRERQVPDSLIAGWAKSSDPWWRRAAVASTVPLNLKSRGGTGDPKRTIAICSLVVDDRHDMVVKALSWALRELVKRDTEPVLVFLDRYRSRLPARVLREVRRKIETGTKN